ncbi:MAG TPA: [FeFe] hydrogenase H-cluster radical SAM maturase HydE [Rectinemataceae bacterium]|nr:[FeFe] hydrogenase H-cluster radical SAM maturase HydE [Rectinemataceae bacterium]
MTSTSETAALLDLYRSAPTEELGLRAREVCEGVHGSAVLLRALIEFSNACSVDCLYCGIRAGNAGVERYRLTPDELVATAVSAYGAGLRSFVLQSAEDAWYSADRLAPVLERIRSRCPGAAITLSCGIKSREEYHVLHAAGADRYLLRFETSDPELHRRLRGGISLERRLRALEDLRQEGYQVGSGFMVGLPGETEETRIANALLCVEFGLDMIGIGPFIPHPATPLAGSPQQPLELTLRMTSLLRLLMPEVHLPATTAAGSLDPQGREKMILAGANVLMPTMTPVSVRKNYLLYPGKICLDEDGEKCLGCLSLRMKSIGREISFARGDSLRLREVSA